MGSSPDSPPCESRLRETRCLLCADTGLTADTGNTELTADAGNTGNTVNLLKTYALINGNVVSLVVCKLIGVTGKHMD